MTKSLKVAALSILFAASLSLSSCKEEVTPEPAPPTKYSQLSTNLSYSGQTVRLLLADSLARLVKNLVNPGATPVTRAQLEAIFNNTSGLYSDIATNKKLSDKISGLLNQDILLDFKAWFQGIETLSATNAGSANAVTTGEGLYLPEYIDKTLMGAMMYSQAIKYLRDDVPVADNNTVVAGEGTKMEHNWDEAFGYFGASNNYLELSLTQRRMTQDGSGVDANADGRIDPKTERNFFHARYAATADSLHTTFTTQGNQKYGDAIVKAFIEGRQAIAAKDYDKRDAAAGRLLAAWDKVIAANAVRYAGTVKTRLVNPGSFNGQWAELKLFVDMTQYNLSNLLGSHYTQVKALIGDKPADMTDEKIDQIISKIKTAYGF